MNVRNNSLLLRGRVWDPSSIVSTVNSHLSLCSKSPGKAELFCFPSGLIEKQLLTRAVGMAEQLCKHGYTVPDPWDCEPSPMIGVLFKDQRVLSSEYSYFTSRAAKDDLRIQGRFRSQVFSNHGELLPRHPVPHLQSGNTNGASSARVALAAVHVLVCLVPMSSDRKVHAYS